MQGAAYVILPINARCYSSPYNKKAACPHQVPVPLPQTLIFTLALGRCGRSRTLSGSASAPSLGKAVIFFQSRQSLSLSKPFGFEHLSDWFLTYSFPHNIRQLIFISKSSLSRSISTRTIAVMWWFFTLIMMSSYTANLAGMFPPFYRACKSLRAQLS